MAEQGGRGGNRGGGGHGEERGTPLQQPGQNRRNQLYEKYVTLRADLVALVGRDHILARLGGGASEQDLEAAIIELTELIAEAKARKQEREKAQQHGDQQIHGGDHKEPKKKDTTSFWDGFFGRKKGS